MNNSQSSKAKLYSNNISNPKEQKAHSNRALTASELEALANFDKEPLDLKDLGLDFKGLLKNKHHQNK